MSRNKILIMTDNRKIFHGPLILDSSMKISKYMRNTLDMQIAVIDVRAEEFNAR